MADPSARERAEKLAKELREAIAFSLEVWGAGKYPLRHEQQIRRGVDAAAKEVLVVVGDPYDAITVEVEKAIESAERAAAEREREACAQVAEEHLEHMDFSPVHQHGEPPYRCNIAEAIRARGRKP